MRAARPRELLAPRRSAEQLETTKRAQSSTSAGPLCPKSSDLRGAAGASSLAAHRPPDDVLGAPHLVSDEVVAQSVQAAGHVGQTHGHLQEQADPGLGLAVPDHSLVHLRERATHSSKHTDKSIKHLDPVFYQKSYSDGEDGHKRLIICLYYTVYSC